MTPETIAVTRADLLQLRQIVQDVSDACVKINGLLTKLNNDIGQLVLVPVVPAFPLLDKYLQPPEVTSTTGAKT